MKEELQYKIIKLIGLFDYLISINGTEAYHLIRKKYQILLENLMQYENIQAVNQETFDILLNVFKLFLEAPPKNVDLGKYILDRMQEIYLIQKEIEG